MGHQVEIRPSRHRFVTQPGESLLESALRAGLNIKYNCNGGSCGECRARLVSGRIESCAHQDYVLPAHEKNSGNFLLCTHRAVSDITIETDEAGSTADIPYQHLEARISKVEPFGDDYLLLSVRTPRTRTLRFLAGQHVALRFEDGVGADHAIGSCPCNGMTLQFHLARDPADPFMRRVFDGARNGTRLSIEGPFGDCTLDETSDRPLVLVAEGVGFAPLRSLLEHVMALEMAQPRHLFWIARRGGHYLDNLCRSWSDALDEFSYTPLIADGMEAPALVQQVMMQSERLAQSDLYMSVGPELEESLARDVLNCGIPAGRIFSCGRRNRR